MIFYQIQAYIKNNLGVNQNWKAIPHVWKPYCVKNCSVLVRLSFCWEMKVLARDRSSSSWLVWPRTRRHSSSTCRYNNVMKRSSYSFQNKMENKILMYLLPVWNLTNFFYCITATIIKLTSCHMVLGLGRYSHYRYTIDTDINRYVSIWSSCCIDTDDGDSRINNDYYGTKSIHGTLDFHTKRQDLSILSLNL